MDIRRPIKAQSQEEICKAQDFSMSYCSRYTFGTGKLCPGTCLYYKLRSQKIIEGKLWY